MYVRFMLFFGCASWAVFVVVRPFLFWKFHRRVFTAELLLRENPLKLFLTESNLGIKKGRPAGSGPDLKSYGKTKMEFYRQQ